MTEFDFIDRIKSLFANLPDNGFEGIGDDCAVMPLGGGESLVLTTDMLVENIHFLRCATSPAELGRKSLAVNLSDVAAMGARPVATLLSLSLPANARELWAEEFMAGYRELSEEFGIALVGGDTTRSYGDIIINVVAIGRVENANIKRRSGARAGDVIFAAGELGASGAGLREILAVAGTHPELADSNAVVSYDVAALFDSPNAEIHRNPPPQVREGIWLGGRGEVHAMMDISDGLASDLRHIIARSSEAHAVRGDTSGGGIGGGSGVVGAEIDLEAIPVAEGADLQTAACGGEDYKLLLTADPAAAERLAEDFFAAFGAPLYPIGRITNTSGLRWLRVGRSVDLDWKGFTHY